MVLHGCPKGSETSLWAQDAAATPGLFAGLAPGRLGGQEARGPGRNPVEDPGPGCLQRGVEEHTLRPQGGTHWVAIKGLNSTQISILATVADKS